MTAVDRCHDGVAAASREGAALPRRRDRIGAGIEAQFRGDPKRAGAHHDVVRRGGRESDRHFDLELASELPPASTILSAIRGGLKSTATTARSS